MTNLKSILSKLDVLESAGNLDIDIKRIRIDSRNVEEGDLFLAIKGFESDGHQFISQAIAKGAVAICCESFPEKIEEDVAFIKLEDSRSFLADLAKVRYDSADEKLIKIAITGTNGKTSTAFFLQQMLNYMDQTCGLIGTIIYDTGAYQRMASHTTPEAHILFELFDDMQAYGCNYVVMEVSSHALALNRVDGLFFERAIFTNFSQDHLDFHKSMEDYFAEKVKLFQSHLKGIAILSQDNEQIRSIECEEKMSFSIAINADVKASSFLISMNGSEFSLAYQGENYPFETSIVGRFNLSNILAAIATLLSLDFPMKDIQAAVKMLKSVAGRMEKHLVSKRHVIIDYAHTPDALESVLKTCRTLSEARLICVFGCGGDRDRDKRAKMAQAAEKYADHSIVTSDNPRREEPNAIIDDIVKGFKSQNYEREADRKSAIFKALELATERDLIVIAGKGHENYQDIQNIRHPFNDAEVIYQWKRNEAN